MAQKRFPFALIINPQVGEIEDETALIEDSVPEDIKESGFFYPAYIVHAAASYRDIQNHIMASGDLLEGEQWYSGDHGMFAFQGIPCIAVTSSDMFTDAIKLTHTKNDIPEHVAIDLLKTLSKSIQHIIEILDV